MRIIGVTVGTTTPKPSFDQTDPRKGDYIKGDRSFLSMDTTLTQSGKPADAQATGDAINENKAKIDEVSDTVVNLSSAVSDKVNISDIIDNLTTTTSDQALSANQGVVLQDQINEINSKLVELMYEVITIPSFTVSSLVSTGTGGTFTKSPVELGTTVTSVTLAWDTNKTPSSLVLDGNSIDVSKISHTYSDLNLTTTKTYTLKAVDERDAEVSKTTTLTFCNNIYYGIGTTDGGFDSAFVTGLSKRLQTAKAYDFTVNPTAQYIYYAVPTRLGTVSFKVGGFEGGFESPETVSVTNGSGYTENYYVYRSTNKITGSTTVDVT